jgi:hypothetical protein
MAIAMSASTSRSFPLRLLAWMVAFLGVGSVCSSCGGKTIPGIPESDAETSDAASNGPDGPAPIDAAHDASPGADATDAGEPRTLIPCLRTAEQDVFYLDVLEGGGGCFPPGPQLYTNHDAQFSQFLGVRALDLEVMSTLEGGIGEGGYFSITMGTVSAVPTPGTYPAAGSSPWFNIGVGASDCGAMAGKVVIETLNTRAIAGQVDPEIADLLVWFEVLCTDGVPVHGCVRYSP